MKIVIKEMKEMKVQFVTEGQVFMYQGEVYVKTASFSPAFINAFNLSTNNVVSFGGDEMVTIKPHAFLTLDKD